MTHRVVTITKGGLISSKELSVHSLLHSPNLAEGLVWKLFIHILSYRMVRADHLTHTLLNQQLTLCVHVCIFHFPTVQCLLTANREFFSALFPFSRQEKLHIPLMSAADAGIWGIKVMHRNLKKHRN